MSYWTWLASDILYFKRCTQVGAHGNTRWLIRLVLRCWQDVSTAQSKILQIFRTTWILRDVLTPHTVKPISLRLNNSRQKMWSLRHAPKTETSRFHKSREVSVFSHWPGGHRPDRLVSTMFYKATPWIFLYKAIRKSLLRKYFSGISR